MPGPTADQSSQAREGGQGKGGAPGEAQAHVHKVRCEPPRLCSVFLASWQEVGKASFPVLPCYTVLSKESPLRWPQSSHLCEELKAEPAFRAGSPGNSGMSLL